MIRCTFRFYEELNDYLPGHLRKREAPCCVERETPVGDLVKGFGIPLEEVDLILVDGLSVDFSHVVKNGERVSVYPIFETFDITGITKVRNRALRFIRSSPKTEPK